MTIPHRLMSRFSTRFIACTGLAIMLTTLNVSAATIVWSGASGTDTNWSTGANWIGNSQPGGADDVKFYDMGTNLSPGTPNSLVDTGFAGNIGSLQFGETNGFHTVVIATGETLNITNTGGLFVGTSTDPGAAKVQTNSIKGVGATLSISNVAANLVLNQGQNSANGSRAYLDLSGLDNFNADLFAIGIGSIHFQNAVAQRNSGTLLLARTNYILLNLTNTLANYTTLAAATNSFEVAHAGTGNNATALSFVYLGQTNGIYADSISFSRSKASVGSAATLLFNPAFVNPTAYFRGAYGANSRVTWWSIGDMADNASSAQQSVGTNDFSLGTVDALVETMSLGRDTVNQHTSSGNNIGVMNFAAGKINVNTLYVGNQSLGPATSFSGNLGVFNVAGPTAALTVNSNLVLGRTTVTYVPGVGGGGTNGWRTQGFLNIRNGGTVLANSISVGNASSNCVVTLSGGTLVVTNNIGTLFKGLTIFAVTNSILHLNVSGITNIFCTNLVSSGASNLINPDSIAVFSSYPKQITLIKYTSQVGLGVTNFGLTNVPASAPGAYLSNNIVNASLDLVLPFDPRPIITSLPASYSGNPGDNVSFTVGISPNSVTPLTYLWYLGSTLLGNGVTGNGSTISGAGTATLSLNNAEPGDNGNYTVVVTNALGSVTSAPPAVLTISAGCVGSSLTGPNNATVIVSNNVTFSATVAGNPAPDLQWQRNGGNIPGATANTYTLNNVQYPGDDQAIFSLIASNGCGIVTNSATLTVIVPPAITSQPLSLVVTNTQSASFSVTVTGVPTPNYQWYFNNTPISGQTNSTLTFGSATPANIGTYKVGVNNAAGSVTSTNVTLIVNSTMSAITLSPANGATGTCYDTPLYITFSATPTLRAGAGVGAVRIYNVNNSSTPVDTIDLSQGSTQPRAIGGDTFISYPVIITGNTARIYPHAGVMTSNQTYYVTVDDGVFADANGAYFAGITTSNLWQFATKVGGPAIPASVVVAGDGSGDFLTVQGAVDSVALNSTTPITIHIQNGFYSEIVDVKSKNNLHFLGQTRLGTFIGYPNNNNLNPSGAPLRAMVVLNGNDCAFENITLTNTTPAGGAQAEAMDVEGTRATFYNMELDSYQDTFLVHSAGKIVYFQNCLVQGQTDFNWGYGSVYYTNCELRCLLSGGHVTQPRSPATTNGFGFINCRITQGYPGSSAFDLGRTISTPTSPSEALFYNCLMADVIPGYASDAGTNMADYSCSNLTATAVKSLAFSTHSPSNDPYVIAVQTATTWLYGWQPTLPPLIVTNPVSQTVNYGSAAAFNVAATGVPDPTYQWQLNGTNVAGATGPTFSIPAAVTTNGGNYTVVVTTLAGSVTSSPALLTVNPPPNTAPVFTAPVAGTNFTINVGVNLAVSCMATDSDTPAQTLTYSLVTGPSGSAVDSGTGNFTWRPMVSQSNSVNSVTVAVIDNGTPNLSATNSFTVTVNALTAPTASAATYAGGQFSASVTGQTGPDYALQAATNLISGVWTTVARTNSPAAMPFILTDTNAAAQPLQFYRVVSGPPLP